MNLGFSINSFDKFTNYETGTFKRNAICGKGAGKLTILPLHVCLFSTLKN